MCACATEIYGRKRNAQGKLTHTTKRGEERSWYYYLEQDGRREGGGGGSRDEVC